MTHTKGPWKIDEDRGGDICIIAENEWEVCTVWEDPNHYYARLIASAPELLASLEEVLAYCVEHGHDWMCMAQARAAIAKATGVT